MTYSEKLKDPKWQRKRLKILERDNFTCLHCFSTTKTLHVHHLDYEAGKNPWEYPNEWLITLCEKCHEDVKVERAEFEKLVIKQLRLKSHNLYDQYCITEVVQNYKDLGSLFFLLSNLKDYQEELDEMLQLFWYKKKHEFFLSKAEPTEHECKACGNQAYLMKDSLYLCSVCGWEQIKLQ